MFNDALPASIDRRIIDDDSEIRNQFAGHPGLETPLIPTLIVYPGNREDVQDIVKLANDHKTPLVPVSSGPPRFRGGTVPSRGGVIVDFSRMNHIRKIDKTSRYVMVEPGVTYGELVPELKRHGLRLNLPLLPRANKSIVTSTLEREPRLIPKYQYDTIDPLLTLEVVYGTGDDFRTGSASGPGNPETLKADMVNPWGPGSVDFFRFVSGAQGTMGLVTWAVIKTEVLPSLRKIYFIPAENHRDLTGPMNMLLRKRILDECLVLNDVNLAAILAGDRVADAPGIKKNMPSWTLIATVAGYQRRPEERVQIHEKHVLDICRTFGLQPQRSLPGTGENGERILENLSNPWSGTPYWKLGCKNSCRDIFFLTTLSRLSEFIDLMKETVSRYSYPLEDMGCYIQPMVQGRGCHCEFNLPCDTSDSEEAAEVGKLFMDASETLMNKGAFFSRPYGPWAKMVYSRDREGEKVLKKLKKIFDPNNILNPGKLCF